MQKRITTIIGAGAVLDFDFHYPNAFIPSTENITKAIKELTFKGYDKEQCDVINVVYNLALRRKLSVYDKYPLKKQYLSDKYNLNFEELYFLLESMLSLTSNGIEYFDPTGVPPLSTLLIVRKELESYKHVEFERAVFESLKEIISIIERYDSHFREHTDSENWYRKFWKGRDNIKYDIFTFNYDTTIEQCIGDYEDGFELIEESEDKVSAFLPKKLLNNPNNLSTVQHLHGCIYYAECPEECGNSHSNRDFFKMKSVKDAIKHIGRQQDEQTQAKEFFINSPILIGLRKLDKMTFLPSSIFHANLINKLIENRGILIIGYSFSDLYVNQLLQRRLLMYGDNHRLVIIDYFPPYVNNIQAFYRYTQDKKGHLLHFIKPFMNLRIEDFKIKGAEFRTYNDPIYSEDHKCMLFICGFRKVVESYTDLLHDFL